MTLENELESFFDKSIESVVRDSERFRKKLNIGADAFQYLSNAENLGAFTTAITSGAGISGIAYAGWISSMGMLGQIGLAVGFISTPAGWIAAAGVLGTTTIFLTRWLFHSLKKGAVTEVPNFINSPLDILASSICDLICPILLKIAYADRNFCEQERTKILNYFISEWGINPDYVDSLLSYDESHLSEFNWDTLKKTLLSIEKSGDIKYASTAREIIFITEEVIRSDGTVHEYELRELKKLETALGKKSSLNTVPKNTVNSGIWRRFRNKDQPCFIATAVFQDGSHPTVALLRTYRDSVLQRSASGRFLIRIYWILGPIGSLLVKILPGARYTLKPALNSIAELTSKRLP